MGRDGWWRDGDIERTHSGVEASHGFCELCANNVGAMFGYFEGIADLVNFINGVDEFCMEHGRSRGHVYLEGWYTRSLIRLRSPSIKAVRWAAVDDGKLSAARASMALRGMRNTASDNVRGGWGGGVGMFLFFAYKEMDGWMEKK